MLKTPKFWKNRNLIAYLLAPLSWIYLLYIKLCSTKSSPENAEIPVICIGNIVAGGAGKTPTAMAIAKMLLKLGKKPAFISKGYGGVFDETIKVNPLTHLTRQVGDEALLLSEITDCYVCKTRKDGYDAAKRDGADIIILDDGLHDKSLYKILNIMVVDGGYGFGNDMLLPAGPLRDTIKNGCKQADLALIIGEDKCHIAQTILGQLPILNAKITLSEHQLSLEDKYFAFAGIGRPEKFFETLVGNGFNIIDKVSFSDHHQYEDHEIEKLIIQSQIKNAKLITTKKDWIRLSKKYKEQITYLPIDLKFEQEQEIIHILENL